MISPPITIAAIVQRFRSDLLPLYPIREIENFIVLAFGEIMDFSKIDIFMKGELDVSDEDITRFDTVLEGLMQEVPIQYLVGHTVFYGLHIRVNPDVLIPRPETEELIHWILKDRLNDSPRIIDLGTGSGCIALALKDQIANAKVFGVDSSFPALNMAKTNAELNNLDLDFFHFDMLRQESIGFMAFDLMVSNPPYVTYSESMHMHANVLKNEPHSALFVPDDNPLLYYRKIIDLADGHLNKGGKLYFEINEAFGHDMKQLLVDRNFKNVELKKDFNGRDRMIRATKL